jgi:hypothetical protein
MKICKICNKKFNKPYFRSKKSWSKAKFCSTECRIKFLNTIPRTKKHNQNISKSLKGKYIAEKHWSWKGGRIQTKEGYIKVKTYNHPYSDKQNYVSEHRLVMEKHLKRYLQAHEIVHHKNGKRTDNKLENLELMNNIAHSKLPNSGQFNKGHIPWNKSIPGAQ